MNLRSQNEHLCRIEMLGPIRLICGSQEQTRFATQKAEALLAYLALRPGPHPRERVIDLFWPDMDLSAGRNNLSTTLVSLRRQLEPADVRRGSVLVTTHASIGLDPPAVKTDVAEFEQLLKQAARIEEPRERADLLTRAVDLFRADPLPGHYQDWAVLEAERLQTRLQEALLQLTRDREAIGDLGAALHSARRSAALDPYSEDLHYALIRLNVLNGHLVEARETHRRFERLFADEFGTEPSEVTRRAIAEILAQPPAPPRLPSGVAPSSTPVTPSRGAVPEDAHDRAEPGQGALPPMILSHFYGRSAEIAEIGQLLLSFKGIVERSCRLVTLIGPGGIGKTRLSLEFARQAVPRFELWCAFVPLAELTSPTQIVDQIASVLRLSPDRSTPSLDQIIALLRKLDRPEKPPLLVLDNLEHLLTGNPEAESAGTFLAAEVVQTLLGQVPGLILLCTSRRRIGVRGERLVTVVPLPVPAEPARMLEPQALAPLLAVPSVRLYVDRAQAVRPDFGLTPTNAPAVAALCRQLEGNPLALELAAAWVRVLPPRKMWERLTRGQDIPEGSYADLPTRHRTLTAALEWSFRLLNPAQQRLFARLAVFRGGWTQETAETVCTEPDAISLLAELQEASLCTLGRSIADEAEDEVRYDFLETVRAFSRKQLEARGEVNELMRRHAAFFLALAEAADPHLRGAEQVIWFAHLAAEHENLRAALDWYAGLPAEATNAEELLRLTLAMAWFWNVRGHWAEGRQRLTLALARAQDTDSTLYARALNAAAGFAMRDGEMTQALDLFERCLALFRAHGNQRGIANLLHNLAFLALQQGDLDRAEPLYAESLALNRQLGDPIGIADELHHLGWVAQERGDLVRARTLYEESLAIRPLGGDRRSSANTLQNLANIAFTLGDLARAQMLQEQNMAIRRELGDRPGIASALQNLGKIALQQNDPLRARALILESLAIFRDIGDRRGITGSLQALASWAVTQQRALLAARLYGASDALNAVMDKVRTPAEEEVYRIMLIEVHRQLSATEFTAAWEAGHALSWEQIVTEVLTEET
jgi:predicted ATPase/DNA-binding SARP family transcriptional activator